MNPTKQIYSNYKEEDFKVWKILFERQMNNLEGRVASEFLLALDRVKFNSIKIPDFNEVNEILRSKTGWSIYTVPNISPVKEFFNHLAEKEFTATCWLRKMEQLDYLEEPDMFHDVFAHVPFISSSAYCYFLERLGKLANQYSNRPEITSMLGRLYWYTIEFGLLYENGNLKIYGAGIISSADETRYALSKRSQKLDFNIEKILEMDYRGDTLQDKYFVIESLEQLMLSIPEIENFIMDKTKTLV